MGYVSEFANTLTTKSVSTRGYVAFAARGSRKKPRPGGGAKAPECQALKKEGESEKWSD